MNNLRNILKFACKLAIDENHMVSYKHNTFTVENENHTEQHFLIRHM